MSTQQKSCTQRVCEITLEQVHQVPLSCPMNDMEIWNAHPKVFLPILKTGKAVCPYCGALYVIVDFDPLHSTDVTDTGSE